MKMKILIRQKQTEKTDKPPLPPFAPVQFLKIKIMKMKTTRTQNLLAAALVGALVFAITGAQAQEPRFAAKVPESVMTPAKVHTELLGDLEFTDGMPSRATVEKAYDFLDLS